MKVAQLFALVGLLMVGVWGCTPNRGCIEHTADNYDLNAEEDDGTCIPSRDKLIGDFTYSCFWTDVVTSDDLFTFGTLQITEANTANNAFNANLDGSLFLQGTVSQKNLIFEYHPIGVDSYTGTGIWITSSDTVDLVLNLSYTSPLLPIPQPFAFYCKKTP